jgi:hypothetical protein
MKFDNTICARSRFNSYQWTSGRQLSAWDYFRVARENGMFMSWTKDSSVKHGRLIAGADASLANPSNDCGHVIGLLSRAELIYVFQQF